MDEHSKPRQDHGSYSDARVVSAGHHGRGFAQAVGVLVAVGLVVLAVRVSPRGASATDEVTIGLANPIDQRNAMIAELRSLNLRLERIEERLGTVPSDDGSD